MRLRIVPEVADGPKLALKFEAFRDAVTVYPVIAEPPSNAGGSQVTLAFPSPAVAVTFWGALGRPRRTVAWSPGLMVTGPLGVPSASVNVNVDGPKRSGAKCPSVSAMVSEAVA